MRRTILATLLAATTLAAPAFAQDTPSIRDASAADARAIGLFVDGPMALGGRDDRERSALADTSAPEARAFGEMPVEEETLSGMRGGFALPGGLEVSVAVQTDTRVNGLLMLRSVFVVDKTAPTLAVYGRTDGLTGSASNPTGGGNTTSVTIANGPVTLGGATDGLIQLDVVNGATASASGGSVRIEKAGVGDAVTLSQPTLDVSHLTGQAYGSIVANRGNDISVDTVTNINIDLKNTMPSNIGTTVFRVDTLVLDSATRLGR